ncbi:polyhydroxyalkanoate biosynthesis repressor PhaR [Ureibacillus sp. FSL K6-8385]|uniref:Polyhydroxyalkanoate biosynthesis repressor PhaR n=1 Tax=Ureibacillus terrenus TaxID=118246 RepID=A0A540V6U3_9BACL|nr:polyhydroxyalkanoate biosynthesis repressor PhaR [Ureibacillus terrenus]MED3660566.1 polyhydroxyalkanoate biosynthesis repressor PhaR [Ureibacillus terrenus]MED3762686.1 polyhydroxyalkanoate biosynthesis repressor PhaR [Ureibacillus terrenus]TQE92438.1 polyhydroxyalkanoate biosynthesis repressor PhaR [Ureibacillus terrenus]
MSQSSFDVFALWKEIYNRTESVWQDAIQETLEKKSFAESLGQIQSQYVQYQELVNKMTESYLKQANIPTRDEIANVASLIVNVDSKIDQLEDEFDEERERIFKEIDALKKSVASLEKKLDKVIDLLNKSLETTEEPQTSVAAAANKAVSK